MNKAVAMLCAWTSALASAQQGTPAAPLSISKAPMLVDGKVPVPNIFLALDSGWRTLDAGRAWQAAFAIERVPDRTLRLAWLSARECEAIPDPGLLCRGRNGLAPLNKERRNELDEFIAAAGNAGAQPANSSIVQPFFNTVLAHLRRLDAPTPGTVANAEAGAPLKCRQSHLLLASPHQLAAHQRPASIDPPLAVRSIDTSRGEAARSIQDAVDAVLAESQSLPSRTVASLAANSTALASQDTATLLYAARYNARRWSGEIAVQEAGVGANSAPWGISASQSQPHTSASLLDERDPGTRVILSSKGTGKTLRTIAFRWQQLAPAQRSALNVGDEAGQHRLDYLRGDRSREESQGGAFRNRDSRQADSVNAALWHAEGAAASAQAPARPAMLYLGANGGMLHAFSAKTGAEAFAYVPQGMYSRLAPLTRPQYRHEYFVDGSSWTAEIDEAGSRKTLLTGFPGAGGRGYFVLDVSSPPESTEDALVAASVVKLDTTASSDPDIGHITGAPVYEHAQTRRTRQITKLNNGRWALVVGNGYASENQRAVLIIQFLDGARELLKLRAGPPGGVNGLASARLVDANGDQVPDFAYAGDLLGQLWKFDLSSSDLHDWKVAFGGRPLFRARDAANAPQPITAAPLSMPHPSGGRVIVFGTGQMLSDEDRAGTSTQSIYGIHDRDGLDPVVAGRSSLLQQAIEPAPVGASSGRKLWTSTHHALMGQDGEPKRGWYLDLPAIGERVIANPVEYEGKLVDVLSVAPPAAFRKSPLPESCEPPAVLNFRTTLNALDGARPRSELYGDATSPLNASRVELGGEPSVQINRGQQTRTVGLDGKEEAPRQRLGQVARRAAWRQLR